MTATNIIIITITTLPPITPPHPPLPSLPSPPSSVTSHNFRGPRQTVPSLPARGNLAGFLASEAKLLASPVLSVPSGTWCDLKCCNFCYCAMLLLLCCLFVSFDGKYACYLSYIYYDMLLASPVLSVPSGTCHC